MKKILLILILCMFSYNAYAIDTKVTALDVITPDTADMMYCVDDVSGTPVSKSCLVSALLIDANIPDTITIDNATLAATATALATGRLIGGVSFDGTTNIVPTTIAVTDTTDTTSFVALWESATGDLLPQTDLGITYNAGTANLTTTTFTGALAGNSTTSTALAVDPNDCSAGSYTIGVNASGVAQGCTDATTEINSVVNGLGGTGLTCATQSCNVDLGTSIATTELVSPTGSDTNVVTGTSGSTGEIASWNIDGDLVDSNLIVGTLTDERLCEYEATGTFLECNTIIDATTTCAGGSICGGGHTHPTSQVDDLSGTNTGDQTLRIAGRSITLATNTFNADEETFIYKSQISFETPIGTDDFFFDEIAHTVTFTSIYCKTLVGTVDLDVTIGGVDINGSDITCTTSGVLDASLGGDTAGAVGEEVALAITSVASAPTFLRVQLNGTYND